MAVVGVREISQRLTEWRNRRSTVSPQPAPSTLIDPQADALLRSEGWVVVDLLDPAEAASLLSRCTELHPGSGTGWESDFYSPDAEIKRAAHAAIADGLAPGIERCFVDHRSVLHNFVMNWPGPEGGLVLHQHSTVVDERRFRSVIVWCALTPATEQNGTLHVVPRSHLVQRGPRPEHTPSWHEDHEEVLLRDHLTSVPVAPGQALVFDNQLLHCSFANATGEPRLTAAAVVVPNEAEVCYFAPGGAGRVEVYHVDPEFFFSREAGSFEWASPEGLPLVREQAWEPTVVDTASLAAMLPAGTCRHER